MAASKSGKTPAAPLAGTGDAAASWRTPGYWRDPKGKPLSCVEKIKVLNENIDEIADLCQDALEDAILMGGDEAQIRATLRTLVEELRSPFPGPRPTAVSRPRQGPRTPNDDQDAQDDPE